MRGPAIFLATLFLACGSDAGGTSDGDGGNGDGDGGGSGADARVPANCMPGSTQCNDCVDNDSDGFIDGFDPECTGLADDREDSFATGIPGDNIDDVFQDCFFDGNSGHEDDSCQIPTCCILDPDGPNCPPSVPPTLSCTPTQQCIDTCRPAVTPGCDCFGCCTICDATGCYTVMTNPAVAPNCTLDQIGNPTACPTCTQITECANPCGGCVLCPGQDPSTLPSNCTGGMCPTGQQVCQTTADCPTDYYCSQGCCIYNIIN